MFGSADTGPQPPIKRRIRVFGLVGDDDLEHRYEEFVVPDGRTCHEWAIIGADRVVVEHDEIPGTRLMLYGVITLDHGE